MSRILKSFLTSVTLLSALIIIQCGSPTIPPSDPTIIGKWQWVQSIGGIGGWTRTPETENHDMIYSFNSDSTYTIKTIDSFSVWTIHGSFNIQYERIWQENDSGYVIYLNENTGNNKPRTAYEIENDTLYLSEICADCFTHKYVRIEDI